MSIDLCRKSIGVPSLIRPALVSTEVSFVEQVAAVVSCISVIGEARNALTRAGWTATIAANRITIEDAVVAQLIPARFGNSGLLAASWIISSIAGDGSVRIDVEP